MKVVQCILVNLFLIILLVNNGMMIFAMNTGFIIEELTEQEKNTVISNLDISVLKNEPEKKAIECFDVNQNDEIAIVYSVFDKKTICVYNETTFLYGFTFNSSGSIGVEWDGSNLNIYFVRSDVIISINSKGEILNVAKAKNTVENNSYVNSFIYSRKRIVGDKEYIIKNNSSVLSIFSSSYSQLIVVNTDGNETILYDVSSLQAIKILTVCSIIIIFFLLMLIIIRNFNKIKRGT